MSTFGEDGSGGPLDTTTHVVPSPSRRSRGKPLLDYNLFSSRWKEASRAPRKGTWIELRSKVSSGEKS